MGTFLLAGYSPAFRRMLWNPDVTNLECTPLITKSAIFSTPKGEKTLHILPQVFFFLHLTMLLKLWEGVQSNTENSLFFDYHLTMTIACAELIKARMVWLSWTKGFRSRVGVLKGTKRFNLEHSMLFLPQNQATGDLSLAQAPSLRKLDPEIQ